MILQFLPIPEIEYELVLKKWYDLFPSREFRCFDRNRKLLAILQRDHQFYTFLHDMQEEIIRAAKDLFAHMADFELESWVFDMYLSKNKLQGNLIDINPFAPRTDPGLYSWEEILGMAGEDTQIKFVECEAGITGLQFSAQRVPLELVEASHQMGLDAWSIITGQEKKSEESDLQDVEEPE